MENFIHKGRVRVMRGKVKSFNELSELNQKKFIQIKKFICEYFGKEIDVYVHGSYKHGYWDENSDFDVIINERCNGIELDKLILEATGLKANLFPTEQKIGIILIT